jgi:GNAT superfamily N-acetyltransferase
MRLRQGTIADIDTIVEHRVAMYRDMGRTDPEELAITARVSREYFLAAIPSGQYHPVLAQDEEAGVIGGGGVVVVPWPGSGKRPRPLRPWILNVYVRPEFRRRGIARAIMQELMDWCRSQGFDKVGLHASDDGRGLYEQLGFEPTNEMSLKL